MRSSFGTIAAALVATFCWTAVTLADGSGDPVAVKDGDGKYFDKDGNPTYKIQADGTVDWISSIQCRVSSLPRAGRLRLLVCTCVDGVASNAEL